MRSDHAAIYQSIPGGQAIALRIAPNYGLSGFIHAKKVFVTFNPGRSEA